MLRPIRIAGSFAIVSIAYWLYALAAVPFIEPRADIRRNEASGPREGQTISDLHDFQVKRLEGLFLPGSWELDNPMIFNLDESDRVKLLIKTYENLPDGRVKLTPCTLIFGHSGPAKDEEERRRQSIILQAPQGAVLRFDPPFDFNHPSSATEFKDGQLFGEITISSQGKSPSPEDDLRVVGRDLFLTKQAITTPNNVDFKWGPHHAKGSNMVVQLLQEPGAGKQKSAAPNISGIESFHFEHVEEVSLDPGDKGPKTDVAPNVPIVIHCQGPFHFDAVERLATFSDRVEVMKANPHGPRDQILCDVLGIRFCPRPQTNSGPAASQEAQDEDETGLSNLVVEQIEAEGSPVVVSAPSEFVSARGEHLAYNLLTGAMLLKGKQEVMLQKGTDEIHAPCISYQTDPAPSQQGPPGSVRRLGRISAPGPGWLRGQPPRSPGQPQQANQQFELLWKGNLVVEPDRQYQRVSIDGGTQVTYRTAADTCQLNAQEVFLWLLETPSTNKTDSSRLDPYYLVARKNVTMKSTQLTGRVEQAETWFIKGPPNTGTSAQIIPGVPRIHQANNVQPPTDRPLPWQSLPMLQMAQSSQTPATNTPQQPEAAQVEARSQRFEVYGRLLRMNILVRDQQQAAVSRLTLEDGVKFVETQTTKPDERPLIFSGSLLDITHAEVPETMIVALSGQASQPAHFEGRGLGLTGTSINLNRGSNRLWIDGPGQMDLPLPSEMQGKGQAVGSPSILPVTWQRGMKFDGYVATFEQSVVAQTPCQRLATETMTVQMLQPIRFSEPKTQQSPQLEKINCFGGVKLDNLEFDDQKQLISKDHFEATDILYHVPSGTLSGGNGFLNSVRLGMKDVADSAAGKPNPAAPSNANSTQLNGLHVLFHQSLSGNMNYRTMTFRGRVRTTFAPVQSWDAVLDTDNPEVLGPQGIVLRCEDLTVREMPTPIKDQRSVELEAAGDTVAEASTFTATGNRITYVQSKDLLILEGDGRSDAHLYRQLRAGDPRADYQARKFYYSRKSNQVRVDSPSMIEFNQFGSPIGAVPGGSGKK